MTDYLMLFTEQDIEQLTH